MADFPLRSIVIDVDQSCINFCRSLMTHTGALPLHMQVSEGLIRDIAAGKLADGARLPPERDMASDLGIAIGTLRRALRTLEEKGLLHRVQGSGNYVQARADVASIYALFRLELLGGGGLPTAQVLSVDRLAKDPALPAFGPHAQGHRIRRLRFLSGHPAAVEEIWLDATRADVVTADDLSESLYLFYRERLGLRITRAEDRIGLGALPDWSPSAFRVAPGTLLPRITRLTLADDGSPVEASWTWYDPAICAYVARLG
jgi:GntR family transcriptional regulator